MPYATYPDMLGLIPDEWLRQAADDAGTNDSDLIEAKFEAARDSAQETIDAMLSSQYTTPIENGDQIPFLKTLTKYLTLQVLYSGRGYDLEAFPHKAVFKPLWERLVAISKGEMQLDPAKGGNEEITKPRGAVITEKSRTHSSNCSLTA